MKGIPVRANGDPVTRTFVYAGDYGQFLSWCRYSRVNPRSRMVKYISSDQTLRGVRMFDLVYTGTFKHWRDDMQIIHVMHYHRQLGNILKTWTQNESCEIEPDVVD